MLIMVRVLLLIVLVVLGFTAIFPQWLDFSQQVYSDRQGQSENIATTPPPMRVAVLEPIKLFGDIDEDTRYIAKVTYYTTSDVFFCTKSNSDGSSGSRSPLAKTFEFEPLVDNGEHRIEIPLDSVDSNSTCEWQPRYLETCLQRGSHEPKQHCITLFDAKPNTVMHHPTGRMHLGQEMDGNTIDIECGPFDVYINQTQTHTPSCYLPRPYDNDFKFPAIMIENRYALTPGQNVEVNFNFLSVEQAQERDAILANLLALKVEEDKEARRRYEQNQLDQKKKIEQARAAYEAKANTRSGR